MTNSKEWDVVIGQWGVALACIVYSIGLYGVSQGEQAGSARYLTYYSAMVLAAPLLFQSRAQLNLPAATYMFFYLALALTSITVGSGWRGEASKLDFVVICLTALAFLPVLPVRQNHINGIFYFTLLLFAYSLATRDYAGLRFLEMLSMGTGAATTSGYNSNEGLIGPLYAIFFYGVGSNSHLGLAFLMVVIGGKRIGLLAAIAGILALTFIFRRLESRGRMALFLSLFGIMMAINVAAISASAISDYVRDSLGSSVHIEEVMLGRYMNIKIMTEYSINRDLGPFLFGTGVGTANETVATLTGLLPHNDWMKILLDYGIIGSIIITACMAFLFSSSPIGCALGVASAIIMVTDNIIIYLFYQFPLVLMVAYAARYRELPEWPPLLSGRVSALFARQSAA
jgi:hypothetical protein